MELFIGGVAAFIMIFLKGIQTQNVINKNMYAAVITSYLMAVGDIAVISVIVQGGWSMLLPIGTGGAIGIVCSMYFHKRFIK